MRESAPANSRTVLVHEWVTGGGLASDPLPPSWAAEGRAMRRAIAADFASLPGVCVVVTLDHRLPEEPGPWTVARIGPGAEEARAAALGANAHYTVLVAPESDGVLERRTLALSSAGATLLGSTAEAAALAGDKLRLSEHLSARGIAVPLSRRVVPAAGLPERFPYPAVLKPIDGAGSVNTFLVPSPSALPDDAREMPEAILQPLMPGRPMSASFLVDSRGKPMLLGVGCQSVAIEAGRFHYRGGTLPARLAAGASLLDHAALGEVPGRAVGAVEGLRGFVGVDFLWEEEARRTTVLEINPRPTTSIVALTRLLPPGLLARSWIEAVEGTIAGSAADPARIVHGQAPLSFLADGTLRRLDGEPYR